MTSDSFVDGHKERKPTKKENVEGGVNKNTSENEIYVKKERRRRRRRDQSIKTQVNRHIHTKRTVNSCCTHSKHTQKQA